MIQNIINNDIQQDYMIKIMKEQIVSLNYLYA
jgi:hypothetical protein